MSAAARASRVAAVYGMPKDRGRGVRLGSLGVTVRNGRVIVMGRDKGPVSGGCAGLVRPNPGYRAFPQHLIAFVQFADGTKQERSGRFCDEPGLIQAVAWFNRLADQAAADPAPTVPYAGRVQATALMKLAADSQQKAATAKARAEGKPVTEPAAKPARATSGAHPVAVAAGALVVLLLIATVISGVVDGIFLFVQHTVTYPARCAPSAYGPPADICSHSSQVASIVWTDSLIYGIAVVMWLIGLATIVKQGMSGKKAAA